MIEHPSYWIDPCFCRCGAETSPEEPCCEQCQPQTDGPRAGILTNNTTDEEHD